MDTATIVLFIPACFALNMAPGPNNLLSLSNAARYGWRQSCLAGIGRLLAFAVMLTLASAGLAAVLHASELLFYGIKVLGAAYLFYLAIQLWRRAAARDGEMAAASNTLLELMRQEFLVAAGNPKAILIFTAFLPQFVDPARPAAPQFASLGATFLALEWIAIAAYAWMGLRARHWFSRDQARRLFNRGCAALLAGAAAGLLAARRDA